MKSSISIVVPCFNEEEAVPIFHEETSKILKSLNLDFYEFVFVDDGSKDGTLDVLHILFFVLTYAFLTT